MNALRHQRRYMGPLRAVILDWAGTTVDYGSRAPVMAIRRAFEAMGVPVSMEEARRHMGRAKKDHLRAILSVPDIAARWRSAQGSAPTEESVETVYSRFIGLQKELVVAHADLIPGCAQAIDACRARGMLIGSSTGYPAELMEPLLPIAAEKGYRPDAVVTASDVDAGRPAPWMCWENARRLGVYPPEAIVKVDDTTVGIEAGLNAGMWTVGIAVAGNMIGLSEAEYAALADEERQSLKSSAYAALYESGSHVVIDSIADLSAALDTIEAELRHGCRP